MPDRQRTSSAASLAALFVGLFSLVASASHPASVRSADSPFRALGGDTAASLPERDAALDAPLPLSYRLVEVDGGALAALLAQAPVEGAWAALGEGSSPLELSLPWPDGSDRRFRVEESPILEAGLAAQFPEIRTFVVQGLDDPTATGRLSVTALGFHAMVLSVEGTVYIDPYRRWHGEVSISYFQRDAVRRTDDAFRCEVRGGDGVEELDASGGEFALPVALPEFATQPEAPSGATLRTYRLALAATGEYSAAVCAPNPAAVACAMNAIVVSMNRVDGIYEREVAVRMILIANNNLVVYTNGGSDPYTNDDGFAMLDENQANLTSVIGSANYDIGHVFSTGGGGVAALNVPCTSDKAQGVTGSSNPVGDGFDVDYVAHEMGHQFGADHTFNGTTGACGGGNRNASTAYEPGSGSTIMAYAGICGAEDLQPHSDDTFHTKSFDEIVAFSTGATGSSCAVATVTGNTPPVVNAGSAYTIPKQTPFTLTGSATDADSDPLTYMWEEFDLGTAAPPNTDVAAVRPIFRPFVPLSVPSRTFPRLSDILANVATIGESMSTRNRTMTFRLTARDNRTGGGGVNYASTAVTVNAAAGPFVVTAPNTAVTWTSGASEAVTWNVAATTAAPVSCANVAIELSSDGGLTFPHVVAASTPNDGTESIVVPSLATSQARVRVRCVGNIFFDISNANFTVVAAAPGPTLAAVLPISGGTPGGTVVTLTGTNFVSGATVLFGSTPATLVTFNGATSLSATAPAHFAGVVGVTVTNPDLSSSSLGAAFSYFPDLPFIDGYEVGSTAAWSFTLP